MTKFFSLEQMKLQIGSRLVRFLFLSVLCLGLIVPGVVSAQVVDIPDSGLRAAIAQALNKAPGDAITRAEMETLADLTANSSDITDLSGIEFAINLTYLDLDINTISDISPLSSLTNLTQLSLWRNTISDISPLTSLTNLTWLSLDNNGISDISPLSSLTNLIQLRLNNNDISDVETIEMLIAQGTFVYFSGNPAFETPGPKIENGWVWLIVPATNVDSGSDAARSDRDFLSEESGDAVTEADVAVNGARAGTRVGDSVWTAATLDATDPNNLNTIAQDLEPDIEYPVAYGVVSITSEAAQQTRMYIGAGPVKVWLNGTLVHKNTDHRWVSDYETAVPVTLNVGNNLLFIAAYRMDRLPLQWGAFFGFQAEQPVYMYWTDSSTDKVQRANLDGSDVRDIVTDGLRTPTNIALDMNADKVYWTDSGTDTIQRAHLDGSNVEDIITDGLRTPTAIAADTERGNLYWIDSGTDKIQRAHLDGSDIQDVITTGLRTPTDIAVDAYDANLGKVYWTDIGTDKIQRVNFDGSNIEDLVTEGLRTPTSIALDLVAGKMYWTDSGTDKVQRANLDGSNIEDLVTTGLRTPTGIAVDPEAGKIYWTDSGTDTIRRANLDGSNIEDLVTDGLRTPTGIALSLPQIVSVNPPPDTPGTDPGTGPGPVTDPGDADVNGDGQVTVIDLAMVALFYGTQVPDGISLSTDVNSDGTVNLSDIILVAEAIDAAGTGGALSTEDVAVVLEVVAEQAKVIEEVAEAPAHFGTSQPMRFTGIAYRNVAAAVAATKHLATEDARLGKLGKWVPMLKDLLRLLTEMREIPDTTALLPNYPNPFNPETWIPYHLATDATVVLAIYDVRGVMVRTLRLGYQSAGVYQSKHRAAHWDGRNASGEPVASGVYFYTLTAGDYTATRKLLIVK